MRGFWCNGEPFDWGRKRHKAKSLRDVTKQSILAERDTEQQVLLDVNDEIPRLG